METSKTPIQPTFAIPDKQPIHRSLYAKGSPRKDSAVSFVWTNFEFPYPHDHDHWELSVVANGLIRHTVNGVSSIARPGDVMLLRPGDYHSLAFDPNMPKNNFRLINFYVKVEHFKNLIGQYGKNAYADLLSGDSPSMKVSSAFLDAFIERTITAQLSAAESSVDFKSNILLHALVNEYFIQKYMTLSEHPKWLTNLLGFLNSTEVIGLSMEELAKTTPYSYSRLSRIFKRVTGKTILEYITRFKMIYAREILCNSDMGTLEIASLLGIDSLSHFNHLFRKFHGATPTAVRKQFHM
ncbi:MAG: AraC family transcriptional regulator [Clostridiales bacterium]|nr:AraC family transcriptional regulator [Clostridiales bacterium]